MFALPGIVLLLVLDYTKPQEVFPILQSLPMLYLAIGLALAGFVVDLRLGVSRLCATPQLGAVIGLYLWGLATILVKNPAAATKVVMNIIPISLYLVVGHSVQTFRAFQVIAGTLLVIGLGLAMLGVHQRQQDWTCHRLVPGKDYTAFVSDGRPCEWGGKPFLCQGEGAEPGFEYVCERPGMLATSTVGGRVRFRGTLADPNELALAVSITLPFAFAFYERRRGLLRALLLIGAIVVVGLCAIYTRSRGGQLVFLTVLGTYLVRRAGVKGLIAGALISVPVLLLGGRSGEESDQSTLERLEAWQAGLMMLRSSPLIGVGAGQFVELHYLTAHNSYLLAVAECGPLGLYLFTTVLYLSGKTALAAILQSARGELAPVAATWGVAMLAALMGMAVGVFLLSFTYKEVLWIYVGLSGAFYQCVKRHHPAFTVTMSWRERGFLALAGVAFLIILRVYLKLKGIM